MTLPLEWSAKVQELFNNYINTAVWNHPDTDQDRRLYMGYPMSFISKSIVSKGLADFSVGYRNPTTGKTLSAGDKVDLYCYTNMKQHFFECRVTFEQHRRTLEDLFKPLGRALVIDFGCGPATAGLALADLLPNQTFDYIGIDTAQPMRNKASTLWDAATAHFLIQKGSNAGFKNSWREVGLDAIPPDRSVILVFSYFFASKSLTLNHVGDLATWIGGMARTRSEKPLSMFYMNSTNDLANVNYEELRKRLNLSWKNPQTRTITYRPKRGGEYTTTCSFVSDLLTLSAGTTAGTVRDTDFISF